jgi:hypothetical protein
MKTPIKWLIGVGFSITIPLSIFALYVIYFVVRHHMFIFGWSK